MGTRRWDGDAVREDAFRAAASRHSLQRGLSITLGFAQAKASEELRRVARRRLATRLAPLPFPFFSGSVLASPRLGFITKAKPSARLGLVVRLASTSRAGLRISNPGRQQAASLVCQRALRQVFLSARRLSVASSICATTNYSDIASQLIPPLVSLPGHRHVDRLLTYCHHPPPVSTRLGLHFATVQ